MPGAPVIYRPSGRYWVAWQKRYFPTSTKTSDLRGQFRTGVEAFIKALQAAGATVKIDETYRSKQAHDLFRWSYKIANRTARPKDPPPFTGIHIQWDHGNLASSIRGALVAASDRHTTPITVGSPFAAGLPGNDEIHLSIATSPPRAGIARKSPCGGDSR